jgi:GNAT superfamily N-acetyltransferase
MTFASESEPRHGGTLWALSLNGALPPAVTPRVAATYRRVAAESAPLLARAMGLDGPAPVLERFADGKRCYAASVGSALAAYGWVSFSEEGIGELGVRLHLGPDEAYIWDCATLPAYRGQRLYPALLSFIIGDLRAERLRRLWIGASHENQPSQRGMALAGFQPIVDILISRADGHMWAQGRPGAPDALVRDARQALFGAAL